LVRTFTFGKGIVGYTLSSKSYSAKPATHQLRTQPLRDTWYWQGTLWSPSYLAGSGGGAPIATIRQYIEQQRTPP